ncbi:MULTISPECIES: DUF4942 domain-containing protein [Cysteiniphilum]|uniref:DUF4942 domain-containing protein n=1 Tax=Cysteiniphilum litorale TaxID=2056700 RepID=A0A8J2Z2N7_9GAMM|nr:MULTISPECIES: DUF4942 domain-containing protein [Cysteiniphilum]GGF91341.1 hypothetical protein GCM10010995_05730 [Cysteiniphilum litorale]
MINKDFYPTPLELAHRMLDKVKFSTVTTILEPSAGKGDLISSIDSHEIKTRFGRNNLLRTSNNSTNQYNIHAIEIEPELQAILKDKDISVIDSDFLSYSGTWHYDLIMANFPFSDGDRHLHKAIDIVFCGQIVCLLNAETIKNPYTNSRKDLINKLNRLNANIEYIENAFIDAERKTNVEVALIYINIQRDVETEIFGDLTEEEPTDVVINVDHECNEVTTKNRYAGLVASFNATKDCVTTHLIDFYRNYRYVSHYLTLEINDDYNSSSNSINPSNSTHGNLTTLMRSQQNLFINNLKIEYWERVTRLPEVKKYLTSEQLKRMNANIRTFYCKEFTEGNIRQFVLNIVCNFPKHINNAIESLFDKMTDYALRDDRWRDYSEYKDNIHYFNAWKSNSGYKINKKVILPFYYDSFLGSYSIDEFKGNFLRDMEKVMNYFKPNQNENPEDIVEVCKSAVNNGKNRKIDTEYFYISIFKKGTIHLEFKDMDLLRRFNIEACKLKNFLPMEYANKPYNELDETNKQLVNEFESKEDYQPVVNNVRVLHNQNIMMLQKLA